VKIVFPYHVILSDVPEYFTLSVGLILLPEYFTPNKIVLLMYSFEKFKLL
jgi:hypothetical protein